MIKTNSKNNHRQPPIYHDFTSSQMWNTWKIDREKSKVLENDKMLPKGAFEIWELPKPRTVYKKSTNVPKFFRVWVFGKNGFFREVKLDLGGGMFFQVLQQVFLFFFYFCVGYAFSGLVWLVAWLGLVISLVSIVVRYECRHLVCKPLVLFFKIY